MYELRIEPKAARYLKKIKEKQLKKAFQDAIDTILQNPYVGELKTGDLTGVYCYDVYYNKTNYEIAYTILEQYGKLVIILLVGTRENFYEKLKQYIK